MTRRSDRDPKAGFVLPAVLVMLVALALIGAGAAVMTSTEVRIAGLQEPAGRAADAAAAGLEHAAAHFGAAGPEDGWPVVGTIDGYDYAVEIVPDSFDFGAGRVPVAWSPARGFNGDGDGAEVYLLRSTAAREPYRAVQALRLSAAALETAIVGAVGSNSDVRVRGNGSISGRVPEGETCPDGPAILLTDTDAGVDARGSFDLDGADDLAENDPPYVVEDPTVSAPATPEDVLGLEPGALDPYQMSGAAYAGLPGDSVAGVVYVTGDVGSNGAGGADLDGTGVLVVHNPLYDPREHDPDSPLYDPIRAADPAYGPATLGNVTSGTFHGIVIADRIDRIAGNVNIVGAVVGLSRIDQVEITSGSPRIRYSCAAIEIATRVLAAPRRLAWVAE